MDNKSSPFPFNADLGLQLWIKWKKNYNWYSQTAKGRIYADIGFWLIAPRPVSPDGRAYLLAQVQEAMY